MMKIPHLRAVNILDRPTEIRPVAFKVWLKHKNQEKEKSEFMEQVELIDWLICSETVFPLKEHNCASDLNFYWW